MIRRHRLGIGMASILIALGIGGGPVPAILPGDSYGAAHVLISPGSDQERRVAELRRIGGTVIGFNVARPDSADAQRAYEVFAQQSDGLLAIFVFQYAPYEGAGGQTFWVKDGQGIEVPVLTARYSIWEHTNTRPRSGTPARVAREIRETVTRTPGTLASERRREFPGWSGGGREK
jgi:hypothetical protein